MAELVLPVLVLVVGAPAQPRVGCRPGRLRLNDSQDCSCTGPMTGVAPALSTSNVGWCCPIRVREVSASVASATTGTNAAPNRRCTSANASAAIADPKPLPAPVTTAAVCDWRDELIPIQRRAHRESHRCGSVRVADTDSPNNLSPITPCAAVPPSTRALPGLRRNLRSAPTCATAYLDPGRDANATERVQIPDQRTGGSASEQLEPYVLYATSGTLD